MRLIYLGPLALWMALIALGSTRLGSYEVTWSLIPRIFNLLAPGWGSIEVGSLYQINEALRRLSYVVAYAVLTALAVRAIQFGQPELKRNSVIAALALSLVFAVGDALHRRFVPGRHGDFMDVWLSSIGAALVLAAIPAWFRLKKWERTLAAQAAAAAPPQSAKKRVR